MLLLYVYHTLSFQASQPTHLSILRHSQLSRSVQTQCRLPLLPLLQLVKQSVILVCLYFSSQLFHSLLTLDISFRFALRPPSHHWSRHDLSHLQCHCWLCHSRAYKGRPTWWCGIPECSSSPCRCIFSSHSCLLTCAGQAHGSLQLLFQELNTSCFLFMLQVCL